MLNENKPKVMVFVKGAGTKKRTNLLWKELLIREVKKFKYSCYHFINMRKINRYIKNLRRD